MQRPKPETITLQDILITEELSRRNPRLANLIPENQALHKLARQLVNQPQTMLQSLVDMALELCNAGTAGVSLLETTPTGEEVFRWNVLAGALAQHIEGSTPRNLSLCGVCLECGKPVLFSHLDRYFTYFQAANTPIVEGLVLPLIADNHALGTIWIMSHDEQRQFDSEDVRVMTSLADFTAAALLINERQTQKAIEQLRESEAKYRSLFDSIDEGFALIEMIFDEAGEEAVDFRFWEINQVFERQTGFANVTGKKVLDVIPDFDRAIIKQYGRVAKEGEPVRFETCVKAMDDLWFSVYASRVGGEGSRQVAVVFDDITERKRREAHLAFLADIAEDFSRLSSAAEIMQVVGAKVGTYLNISNCLFAEINEGQNQGIIEYTWHTPDMPDMTGVYRLSDFITEEFRQAARFGETIIICDTQTDPRTNSDRYAAFKIHAHVTVPFHQEGEWKYLFTVNDSVARHWREDEIELIREVTNRTFPRLERAHAEAAMRESEIQRIREQSAREEERQRAETLAELDRAKTLFFSNVSHEFRTPLTLLLAPLQDALSDRTYPLALPQRERLEIAHRNSLRLLKLVNNLLDFSRIEAGRMEAVYEPTDLAMFTAELASGFRSAIEKAELRLTVDCPALPEPVCVDQQMWEKIVLNLLSNAFKFTFEGEIAVRLHLTNDHHVILQIQDTGTGIAPEELPHLFKRFYRVRGAKGRTHEGSGIGLALVHELIKLHGGTLDVSSTLGVGSCFTVAIPLAHPLIDNIQCTCTREKAGAQGRRGAGEADLDTILGNSNTISENPEIRTFPSSPSGFHVLIVDDNADMRDYLTRILSEHDLEMSAVADGVAALAAVVERVPDLVLADVMMPQMDGFGLLKALRADALTKEVPIILLSARAGEESVIEGLRAGADDYLIKPFSAQELVARVLAHLQMTQLRSQALHQEKIISRKKDEFLATVSHELNTPLVAILGWTRLLRSSQPSQAMLMKSLETIERNATLQAKLVEDLLDISRITAGKIHLHLQPVELQEIIGTAIASLRQSLETKGVQLEFTLAPSPQIVQGDPDRLQQIILNILSNAVKFTPDGGRIKVELETDETEAHIVISDNGCGIDAELLPYIFDIFCQAASAKKGLGLGLAIARNLVELHGGTIQAESPGIGQGATFIVQLPLLQPETEGNNNSQYL